MCLVQDRCVCAYYHLLCPDWLCANLSTKSSTEKHPKRKRCLNIQRQTNIPGPIHQCVLFINRITTLPSNFLIFLNVKWIAMTSSRMQISVRKASFKLLILLHPATSCQRSPWKLPALLVVRVDLFLNLSRFGSSWFRVKSSSSDPKHFVSQRNRRRRNHRYLHDRARQALDWPRCWTHLSPWLPRFGT